ncbi:MAG TPA: HAMP domain-containing sensor histidine kinase [Anaerolineaceae bacterium]
MAIIIAQIATLFTAPPGNLAYHLALAFTIAGALSASLFQAPLTPNRPSRRLHLGLIILLVSQVLLFLATGLDWQHSLLAQTLFPAADRAFSLVNLLVLAWLWIYPFHLKREKTLAAGAGLLAILLCAGTVAVVPGPRRIPFNLSWPDVAWQIGLLAICLGAIGITLRRHPPGWGLSTTMFMVIGIGHLAQLIFPLPEGDFPGLARLADLAAYPFLLALPGRPLFSSQSDTRPNPFAQNRRRHSTDPSTLKAYLELANSYHSKPNPILLPRAVAHALIADCCYLVGPYDATGQVTLLGGYDLIQDTLLPGLNLNAIKVPSLATALRQGQVLIENAQPGEGETTGAAGQRPASMGNLFFLPFTQPHETPQGGLLLLSPYSNREWTSEDQAYLVPAAAALTSLASARPDQKSSQAETSPAPQPAPSMDLSEVLATQQALQETVERLQVENESLRASAVPHSYEPNPNLPPPGSEIHPLPSKSAEESGLRQQVPEGDFLKLTEALILQMRQSVAATTGFSDLLSGEPQPGKTEHETLLERIRLSTENTRFILEGLTRLVSLQSSPEPSAADWVQMPALVDHALGFIRPQLEEKELALSLDLPEIFPAFQTDALALRQVLVHLLQNAVEVTPAQGMVTIRARLQAEEALSPILVLQVTDQGGGISTQDLRRVFSTSPGGSERPIAGVTGERLSLQVARTLINALNGRIWVEPAGLTSTYSILLPVACAAPTLVQFGA